MLGACLALGVSGGRRQWQLWAERLLWQQQRCNSTGSLKETGEATEVGGRPRAPSSVPGVPFPPAPPTSVPSSSSPSPDHCALSPTSWSLLRALPAYRFFRASSPARAGVGRLGPIPQPGFSNSCFPGTWPCPVVSVLSVVLSSCCCRAEYYNRDHMACEA